MMVRDLISIVVPCYNEEESVPLFIEEINALKKQMTEVNFEIIFVDDGSKDKTSYVIKSIAEKQEDIKYIVFSRNFGKESAMYAGLKMATGDYVAVMDVDLQDPPVMLKEMYSVLKNEGFDCCATRRVTRKGEPPIRSLFAKAFYKIINKISKAEIVDGARDFRLMSRRMVDSITKLKEYNRFSKGIFGWVGFETKWLEYENVERQKGETKWSFWKLFLYSIEGIIAFSNVPLAISSIVGLIFCLVSFAMILFFIVKTLIFGDPVEGYPSLVCILFFLSGIQLFCMGIIGQYLSKAYLEVKNRPIYIIKDSNITNGGTDLD